MGFLAPWFLAGAAAVALPVYLHLLRHRHMDPRPFSSLMFFERRVPSSIKRRRLRYLLLLAFRVALLLLLALAFAGPFIKRTAARGATDKLLVLVIDRSFSMRAGSRLADARRAALALLASRRPSQPAQILTLDSQVSVLTQPTQDAASLRAAVQSVRPGDSRASFGELAPALRSLAETIRTPIELHLFSDMQKTGMPGSFAEMELPSNVFLVLHAVTTKAEPNWTVESVNVPGQVWTSNTTPVHAVIAGYHTPAATRTTTLVLNGKVIATRKVSVPANGRATVEFPRLEVPYGLSRCEVRIDSADSLPDDDVARFGVLRSDPKSVLFVREPDDSRSPLYFGTALESATEAAFKPETVTPDQLGGIKPSGYAFVVISDALSLPASFENALLDYVRRGGGVLLAAGTSSVRGSRIPVFGGTILDTHDYVREGARFLTVAETDTSHPSMRHAEGLSGVKFYFAVRVSGAQSQVIARLADQTPLLIEKRLDEGRVLLLASGLDNLTNDFPLHPAFVAFVEETARYLAGVERLGGERVVDSLLELRTAQQSGASIDVIGPDGRRALSLNQAASEQTWRLSQAGFYEFDRANGTRDIIGVNPDRRESDLEPMPKDLLSLWRAEGSSSSGKHLTGMQPGDDARSPYDLWSYILLLALAAAVAESVLASRYLGELRERP
jgi:hypothetical protein